MAQVFFSSLRFAPLEMTLTEQFSGWVSVIHCPPTVNSFASSEIWLIYALCLPLDLPLAFTASTISA